MPDITDFKPEWLPKSGPATNRTGYNYPVGFNYYNSDTSSDESWDGTNWVPLSTGASTVLTGGTTVEKLALTPTVGQTFYDTTLGQNQFWDGTNWVAILAKAPPREGIVGLQPSNKYRLGMSSIVNRSGVLDAPGIFYLFIPVFVDTSGTSITSIPSTTLYGGTVVNDWSAQASSGLRGQSRDNVRFGTKSTTGYLEMTFPTAFSPSGYQLTIPSDPFYKEYLVDFSIEISYDNGATWTVIDNVVAGGRTSKGVCVSSYGRAISGVLVYADRVINAPSYPSNPSDGQRFFNKSTKVDMNWNKATATWVPAPKAIPVWKNISSAYTASSDDRLLVDTTAAPVTITLPSVPVMLASVEIGDAKGTFATNAVTVNGNGKNIMGLSTPLNIGTTAIVTMVYDGTDWRVL